MSNFYSKGEFVSVWDGGFEVRTPAIVNSETGEISTKQVEEVDGLDCLDREYFETENGHILEVCKECHDHLEMFPCKN